MFLSLLNVFFKLPKIKLMKLLTVVPSRGDNEWAQGYTVFTFF